MAIIFYLIVYMIQTLTLFTIILFSKIKSNNLFFIKIIDLQNLIIGNKFLSYVLAINLFSMAGLPPLLGFFSKFYIFTILIQNNSIYTLILLIIMSCISAYYYVRIITFLFFFKIKKSKFLINIPFTISLLIILCTIINLFFCLFVFEILDIIFFFFDLDINTNFGLNESISLELQNQIKI